MIYLTEWKCENCGHIFTAGSDANGCSHCGSSELKKVG